MPHTIHLIDASPYVFRAYFALPDMRDPAGRPVSAVYGFASFLVKYIAEEHPTHLGVAFDESLTTSFRNDIYPEYKAQRELPPAELEAQLAACQAVAKALGAACFVHDRYEADDLIGTLATQLTRKGHDVLVVTPDKDLAQLVDARVTMFDYSKGVRYDAAAVRAKFGVAPRQVPDFLGLAGDAVDNIPGVRGIGPKTAAVLLDAFGDLDALFRRLDDVAALPIRGAKTLGAKLAAHRDMAFLSRELATIARDAPARADLRALRLAGADPALVDPLFEELGFDGIRTRITRWR